MNDELRSISIIIPSLHSPLIDQVVAALQHQSAREYIREIIVIGQDQHGLMPQGVTFIETPRPISAAAARNLGARHASGTYLHFIDSDCVAAPDLIKHIHKHHAAGHIIVGGSIALGSNDYWVMCDHMLIFSNYLPGTAPGERPFLPSGNFSIERELFFQFGGFDERFPGAAGEEVDLCIRLHAAGYPLLFEPRAEVAHRHPRIEAHIVWKHLRRFGQVQVIIWKRHPEQTAAPLGGNLRPLSGILVACAPLLALRDIVRIFGTTPALWQYWRLIPGMIFARIAWYWGIVEALLATNE